MNDWIFRMLEYGFIENVDYMSFTEKTVKPKGRETFRLLLQKQIA